jgi:hypothetical protein
MIPRSRWKRPVEGQDGGVGSSKGKGIVGIINDNETINMVYDLVLRSSKIDYRLFHLTEDYSSFVRDERPACIVLEFDSLRSLDKVVEELAGLGSGLPQLIYYGMGFDVGSRFEALGSKVKIIRYGCWRGLLETMKKAIKGGSYGC